MSARPTLAEVEQAARRIAESGGFVMWRNAETGEVEILAEAPPTSRRGPEGQESCATVVVLGDDDNPWRRAARN